MFDRLEARLGHAFKDKTRLRTALTHASVAGDGGAARDNERLEFLGDRVLGLLTADWLLKADPDAEEGELARRLNALVRREACAEAAEAMGLGEALILAKGEARSGGREKAAILADAAEAVLGAVHLDGGLEAARAVYARFWPPLAERLLERTQDAKSALQEWLQARGASAPDYRIVARSGPDHRPLFTVEVQGSGLAPARGEASSKRAAEQAAAEALLIREGVWRDG